MLSQEERKYACSRTKNQYVNLLVSICIFELSAQLFSHETEARDHSMMALVGQGVSVEDHLFLLLSGNKTASGDHVWLEF